LPPLFLEVAPNPSAGWCRVSYTAPTPAMLGLYDSAGRLVERLALEPRRHIITWPAGLPLPSGNYFLVLEAGRERTFKKLSLIR